MGVLLNVSTSHLWWKDQDPEPIGPHHHPSFLAFPQDPDEDIHTAHDRLGELVSAASGMDPGENDLAKVYEVREPTEYRSFWDHGRSRPVIPVAAKRSFWVPEISERLFFDHGFYTCEHDIPYRERALADLATEKDWWLFDTKGRKQRLDVLTYDIETTQYAEGKKDIPVDMIGYSEFGVEYEASKDLETEAFDFQFHHLPQDWEEREVIQHMAHNVDEELDMLHDFTRLAVGRDLIAGHNILGFDNKQIHDRIRSLVAADRKDQSMSPGMKSWFETFTQDYSRMDRSFHFGTSQDIANWHPVTFDTFHAARKFYFFHDDFSLKGLAPWLGVHVPDRVHMEPDSMKLDATTLKYNKHDVQEQLGITQTLIAQALPLAFTVNLPLDDLLTGGNTKMWDHMAFLRARRRQKIMPATCRAMQVCRTAQRLLPGNPFPTREQVADAAHTIAPEERGSGHYKEFVRVAKQGPEMPFWMEHPGVMASRDAKAAATTGYDIVGGLTLKPDSDLKSHFVPWFHVVEADVGAMYPTILKARNLTADTIRPARAGETPDEWIWLLRLDDSFAENPEYVVRKPSEDEQEFTKGRGWMVGVVRNPEEGMVNLAMTGILDTIQKVKDARADAKKAGAPKQEVRIHDMTYASLKAARNAGTHGIMVAVNVSCRQFNMWGGATITTIGQRILHETQLGFEKRGRRVVYGDSIAEDRCVVVRDPAGLVRVVPVGELFDEVGGDPHVWHGKDAVTGNGWQALSSNDPDGQGRWSPIKRVIRHATDKPIVRVRQTEGETVCTEDHSIMVRQGGKLVRARPEDALVAPLIRARPPTTETMARIDLLEWISPLAGKVVDASPPNRLFRPPRRTLSMEHDDDWIWFNLHTRPDLGPQRVRRFIDVGTPECSALCRLMGAYVAEGSVTFNGKRRGASIAQADSAWLERLQADYDSLFEGVSTSIIASDTQAERVIETPTGALRYDDQTFKLQMTNVISAVFFWALGGKGSRHKRVPDFVFNLPEAHRNEFLETAIEGDGSRNRDPRYRPEHRAKHYRYDTSSTRLASGMSFLMQQSGIDHGIRYRASKQSYTLWTREASRPMRTASVEPEPYDGPVYDLEVEGDHTFVDAMGSILLHNTDGIYLACSKSAGNLPHLADAIGADVEPEADKWITMPDDAIAAIDAMNDHWRRELEYPGFELEAEVSDAMVFIVHKNYLKFSVRDGKLQMETKGNNFKGSDKAPLARTLLAEIMHLALKEVATWDDEEDARERMKTAIKRATGEVMKDRDVTGTGWDELTLRQQVRPIRGYKPNPDGSASSFAMRSACIEQLLGEQITASRKMKFIVCKQPLPGYVQGDAKAWVRDRLASHNGLAYNERKPTKSGIKPMEFMWPIDLVEPHMVDWTWYKDTVEAYVKGAFGFRSLELATQRDLSSWF